MQWPGSLASGSLRCCLGPRQARPCCSRSAVGRFLGLPGESPLTAVGAENERSPEVSTPSQSGGFGASRLPASGPSWPERKTAAGGLPGAVRFACADWSALLSDVDARSIPSFCGNVNTRAAILSVGPPPAPPPAARLRAISLSRSRPDPPSPPPKAHPVPLAIACPRKHSAPTFFGLSHNVMPFATLCQKRPFP